MIYRLYFTVKGKEYIKQYRDMDAAYDAQRYVKNKGATDIEIRVCPERKPQNEEI